MVNDGTKALEAIQNDIVAEFDLLAGDYEATVLHIMDLGAELPTLTSLDRKAEYLVEGCLSSVWVLPAYRQGRLFLRGDSNAAITKGLLALLLRVYSGQKAEDIVEGKLFFPKAIGLERLMSVQRQGGLDAVTAYIVAEAKKYCSREESTGE